MRRKCGNHMHECDRTCFGMDNETRHYHQRLEDDRAGARAGAWVVLAWVVAFVGCCVWLAFGDELEDIKREVDLRGQYVKYARHHSLEDATGEVFQGNCARYAVEYVKAYRDEGYTAFYSLGVLPDGRGHAWARIYKDGNVYVADVRNVSVVQE